MRKLLCIAVVACRGGSASKPSPSNVAADAPPPAAANPARKWGYPTDAECSTAVDHVMKIAKTDAASAKAIAGNEATMRDEGFEECRRRWMLGQVDCINGTTTFEALDGCMSMSYEVPDAVDVSTAPGRAMPAQCKAALDHMITIAPRSVNDDTERAETTDQCLRYWRPYAVACVMAATTKDALASCFS